VKKSFSGYLVDPLRLLHRRGRDQGGLIEKSMVRPTFSSLGRFAITDSVVAAIAERACVDTEGIAEVLKVAVDSRPEGVTINIDVMVSYGYRVIEVLRFAQRQARDIVDHMTAINVLALNIVARRISLEGRREPVLDTWESQDETDQETAKGGS
jgi:uncharacterized alkaline shock family protein YloU